MSRILVFIKGIGQKRLFVSDRVALTIAQNIGLDPTEILQKMIRQLMQTMLFLYAKIE